MWGVWVFLSLRSIGAIFIISGRVPVITMAGFISVYMVGLFMRFLGVFVLCGCGCFGFLGVWVVGFVVFFVWFVFWGLFGCGGVVFCFISMLFFGLWLWGVDGLANLWFYFFIWCFLRF